MRPSRWLLLAFALLAVSMLAGRLTVSSGPYVPASDSEVLATVPRRAPDGGTP